MAQLLVKIPKERIGVLIGPGGDIKGLIQKRLSVNLEVDSEAGDVTISLDEDKADPSLLFKARDAVTAIGRGFSPERAFKLLEDEDSMLVVLDLREIFGRSESDIRRIKGRIIGKDGKMRSIMEEMSETLVSVYGYTIAIIGSVENVEIAREAVNLLIKGSQHATVYRYLQRKKQELKKKKLQIWEGSQLKPKETDRTYL